MTSGIALIRQSFTDYGDPHSNRCTGLSALIAIPNSDFTSSKPTISSNNLCLFPMRIDLLLCLKQTFPSLFLHRLKRFILFNSPFFSHYSLIRRTLDYSAISCKNIVIIQLCYPFINPTAKPVDMLMEYLDAIILNLWCPQKG
jgi:hypothetical protein